MCGLDTIHSSLRLILSSLSVIVLSSQVSEMHTMCGLDTIHSSLRLSSLGSRLLALKWRRVTLFTGLEVLPPLRSLLKKRLICGDNRIRHSRVAGNGYDGGGSVWDSSGLNGDFIDTGITRGIFIKKATGATCMSLGIIDNSWFRTGLEVPRSL